MRRLKAAWRHVDTDLSEREVAGLAWAMRGVGGQHLRIVRAPGSPGRGGMWHLHEQALADQAYSLRGWVMDREALTVSVLAAPDASGLPTTLARIRSACPNARVRVVQEPKGVPHAWVSYADGLTDDETRANHACAVRIAEALELGPPHKANRSYGVVIALVAATPSERGERS